MYTTGKYKPVSLACNLIGGYGHYVQSYNSDMQTMYYQ